MESEGVLILVDKKDVESWDLRGMVVDFEAGRFAFEPDTAKADSG